VLYDPTSFLARRQQQEQQILSRADTTTAFGAVLTVEVNTTELCNRTCGFCPRVDRTIYPNRNLNISLDTAEVIARELSRLNYQGQISFSGFGECLLHQEFPDIVKIFRTHLPGAVIETNTNGDRLTRDLLVSLFDSGLTYLYWNLYDGPDQLALAESVVTAAGLPTGSVMFRAQWTGADNNKTKNNRSGAVDLHTATILPLKQPCYYPFYKLFIDWNGDVLCCSNDWLRKRIIGNVLNEPIDSIWTKPEYTEFRQRLLASDRNHTPCKTCDVQGTLFGEKSADIIRNTWG